MPLLQILRPLFSLLSVLVLVSGAQAQSSDEPAVVELGEVAGQIAEISKRNGVEIIVIKPTSTAVVVDQAETASAFERFRTAINETTEKAGSFFGDYARVQADIDDALSRMQAGGENASLTYVVLLTLAALAVAWWLVHITYGRFIVRPWLSAKLETSPGLLSEKVPVVVGRLISSLIGLLITVIVGYGLLSIAAPNGRLVETTTLHIVGVFIGVSVVAYLWRMIFAPYLPTYRIPKFHPNNLVMCTIAARKIYKWLLIGALISALGIALTSWLSELGASDYAVAFTALAAGLIAVAYNICLVFANRNIVSGAILKGRSLDEVGSLSRIAARLWLPIVMLYYIAAGLNLAYVSINEGRETVPTIASSYLILVSVFIAYGLILYLIEVFFQRRRRRDAEKIAALEAEIVEEAPGAGLVADETVETSAMREMDNSEHSLRTFEDLAARIAALGAMATGIYVILRVWRLDELFATAFNRFLDVAVVCLLGYVAYHFVRIWIDKRIEAEGGAPEAEDSRGDEGGGGGASRLATLLPLFRNFLLIVISITTLLIALMELGVNVGPLFAGAGVVGLAIGFGSQTMVRDIFSGAFFLFDDAFRRGEYIDIGEVRGTVEDISIRSFKLRHHLGPLHTIPFGEIRHLTNYSRDWVIMKLPLRVTYDTDVERVRKLIKKLGQRLLEDPVIGGQFLEPLKSQGVLRMEDSAMIIRVKFMTKPGDQWSIRKRIYQEIRDLFEREGIKFAHREVTVRVAEDQVGKLSEEQKKALAAAALDSEIADEAQAQSIGDLR